MRLPERWADGSLPPRSFELPAEWRELDDRYRMMVTSPRPAISSAPLDNVFAVARAGNANRAFLEREYVDADYRDEFANFYAQTYRNIPDRCERIHFFDERRYLGFVVMRPILGQPVCRTVLAPPPELESHISCTAAELARPFGTRLQAVGFPYISQDAQLGTCAHASSWMIALYHHLVNGTPRVFTSQIARAAARRDEVGRVMPSGGLTYAQVAAAMREIGLPILPYFTDDLPAGETLDRIVCRYLDSRMPILLATDKHAMVLIGYGLDDDGSLFFIRHDDARGPYQRVKPLSVTEEDGQVKWLDPDNDVGEWKGLFIPLPGRIYMAGEAAEQLGTFIFEDVLEQSGALADRLADLHANRLRFRTYVIQAGDYKHALRRRLPDEVARIHIGVSTPRWIWVVELQDSEAATTGRKCVIGEVALDATCDPATAGALFGNVPGRWFSLPALGERLGFLDLNNGTALYDSGTALHA